MTYHLLPSAGRSEAQMSRATGTVELSDLLLDSIFNGILTGVQMKETFAMVLTIAKLEAFFSFV